MLRQRTHQRSRGIPWPASGSLTICACGLFVSVAVVAVLGAAVGANDPISLDRTVDRLMPHPSVGDGALLASRLGDIGGEKGAFAIAAIAGLLVWIRSREWITGLSLIAAYTGASATTFILKVAIGRRGPAAVDPTSQGFSFPSAHAARVFAVLALLVVLTALFRSRKAAVVLGAGGSLALAAMMVAQLYLRHHWLTDQMGGIAIGAGWTCIMVPVVLHVAGKDAVVRVKQRRGERRSGIPRTLR
jgi:membrane-associated phospholipid phosphatase